MRQVGQPNTEEVSYSTAHEAAAALGLARSAANHLLAVARGKRPKYRGYVVRFEDTSYHWDGATTVQVRRKANRPP